jgi:hypothetical protein
MKQHILIMVVLSLKIHFLPIEEIFPAPENSLIYRPVDPGASATIAGGLRQSLPVMLHLLHSAPQRRVPL